MGNDSESFLQVFSKNEFELVESASSKYGENFEYAISILGYSNSFVKGILKEESWIFISFLASVTNNLTQSLLALLRKHNNISHLILRQAVEASVLACYSLYSPIQNQFIVKDEKGEYDDVQSVKDRAYSWFDMNYNEDSRRIKKLKKMINERHSHSNLSNSMTGVKFDSINRQASVNFFDNTDDNFTRGSLIGFGSVTMQLIDIISSVIVSYPLVLLDENINGKMESFRAESIRLLANLSKQ